MILGAFIPLPDALSAAFMLAGSACLFFAIEMWRDPVKIATWVRRSVGRSRSV